VIDTATHLPGVLKSLEPVLNKSGYLAVAGFVLFEDFGVPVPGETILIVGALYAGTGRLSLPLVVLFGFLAAVTGDNIGFAIGHFGGRPLLARYGRYVLLSPARIDKATALFDRHGGKIIVAARLASSERHRRRRRQRSVEAVSRLQRDRCRALGRTVDHRRVLLRQPHR
jgi:hypothetical protein